MIPYVPQPVWYLGPLTIHAFGVTSAAALVVGYWLTLRRAHALGIDGRFAAVLFAAIAVTGLIAGFASGYAANGGISSVGLVAGACFAAWLLLVKSPDRWRYFDVLAYAFPITAAMARFGCFLAHDHIGARTDNWLGVRFPGGTRFDLGLLQFMAAIVAATAIWLLSRGLTTPGLLFAFMATLMGAGRLVVMPGTDTMGLILTLGGLAMAAQRLLVDKIRNKNASDIPYPLE